MKRLVGLAAALTLVAAWGAPVHASSGTEVMKKIFVTKGQSKPVTTPTVNIQSHGGPVQTSTSVYLVWWGPEWASGWSSGGYSSQQAQNYVSSFFGSVGGSRWIGTDTQYCQNVPSGTTDCSKVSGAQYITNPGSQLKGTWNDTTTVPGTLNDNDIQAAALRAAKHFGYNPQATYMIFSPTGKSEPGFRNKWCAWHSSTSSTSGPVAYGYIPYQPDAGEGCGENFINAKNDAFGHGYFDGFSVVAGHEYEEAQTDPDVSTGWYDANGWENADKCAWNDISGNVRFGSQYFAVQPVWSNKISGCTLG